MPKRIIGYQISFVAEIFFTAAYTAIGTKMERPRNNLKSKRVERKNGNSLERKMGENGKPPTSGTSALIVSATSITNTKNSASKIQNANTGFVSQPQLSAERRSNKMKIIVMKGRIAIDSAFSRFINMHANQTKNKVLQESTTLHLSVFDGR